MKFLIVGLGNFGASLAEKLTNQGNEVIGIDKQMDKVNLVKDKISHAICMDSTNELAYEAVPLKDADKVGSKLLLGCNDGIEMGSIDTDGGSESDVDGPKDGALLVASD